MLEVLSGDGISRTLLIMGVWATTGAVTGDLDTHTRFFVTCDFDDSAAGGAVSEW